MLKEVKTITFTTTKYYFFCRKQLKSHLEDNHWNLSKWECDQCTKKFVHFKILLAHINHKHIAGEFVCSVVGCNETNLTKSDAYDHFSKSHLANGNCSQLKDDVVIQSEAVRSSENLKFSKTKLKMYDFESTTWKYKILYLKCIQENCPDVFESEQKLICHANTKHNITEYYRCLARGCETSFKFK